MNRITTPAPLPRISKLIAIAALASVATLGCDVEDEDHEWVERVESSEVAVAPPQLEAAELNAQLIEPEFFPGELDMGPSDFEIAREDGFEVPGLDITSGDDVIPRSVGSKPFHIQKYGHFGNGGTLNTGFPTSSWVATVVGIQTTDGDINEFGSGSPLLAYPFQQDGRWHVTFDFRSHGDNESWSIWIMYVNRDMATTSNF